jgi:hypothetical protein
MSSNFQAPWLNSKVFGCDRAIGLPNVFVYMALLVITSSCCHSCSTDNIFVHFSTYQLITQSHIVKGIIHKVFMASNLDIMDLQPFPEMRRKRTLDQRSSFLLSSSTSPALVLVIDSLLQSYLFHTIDKFQTVIKMLD